MDLRSRIAAILRASDEALRIPQIEVALKNGGDWDSDTFDVRDAVGKLIREGVAEFVHPGYLVKLVDSTKTCVETVVTNA